MSFLFLSGPWAALALAVVLLAVAFCVQLAIPFPRRPENRQRVLRANFAFWLSAAVLTSAWAVGA